MSLQISFRYEVQVSSARIWTVRRIFSDRGDAVACARAAFARPAVDGVMVTRFRATPRGRAFDTVILHEERGPVRGGRGVGLVDRAPACSVAHDILRLDGRLTILHVLDGFLRGEAITPTELLHHSGHMGRLRRAGDLLDRSIRAIARAQAQALGGSARDRLPVLRSLLSLLEAEVLDAEALCRRLPPFDAADLPGYSRRVAAEAGPDRHAAVLLSTLSEHLRGCVSLGHKLDRTLHFLAQDLDEATGMMVEGILADLLAFGPVLRDLFGPQPCLADRLDHLADLLHGRVPPEGQTPSARLQAVILLVGAGRAPSAAAVLLERLLAELEGGTPLDERDPGAEALRLEALALRLHDGQGALLGGQRTEGALAQRRMRARQDLLRRLGLHDVADALPRSWQPD